METDSRAGAGMWASLGAGRQAGLTMVGYAATGALVGVAVVATRLAFPAQAQELLAPLMEVLRAVVTS